MTKEILIKIKDTLESVKKSNEFITYDNLEEFEKRTYNKIWNNLLKSFKNNPYNYSYTILTYPEDYITNNIRRLLINDGINIIKNDSEYNKYIITIEREKIIGYSKTLIMK